MNSEHTLFALALTTSNDAAFSGDFAARGKVILHGIILAILLLISLIDAHEMIIPNGLSIALLACGTLAIYFIPEITITSRFIGLACVSLPLLLISLLFPGSFGGGDVKLMAAAGFLLGWQNTFIAACIGLTIGGIYGVYLMAFGKKGAKEHFAFGPALCVGIALALFFGSQIGGWYPGFP